MKYADLHIHALFSVDDGAKTVAEMQAMVDASYADGIRTLCVTPHYHPGYFGENHDKIDFAFSVLSAYVCQRYPEMELCLGNELRYSRDCISWLRSGQCHTLNGTQYVLVDFSETAEAQKISQGMERLLNAGYRPVLAHVERYRALWGKVSLIRSLQENGVLLQVDAQSLLGGFGYRTQLQSKHLMGEGFVMLICSDAHDIKRRPPALSHCYQLVQKKYGTNYAQAVFRENGLNLLHGEAVKGEFV